MMINDETRWLAVLIQDVLITGSLFLGHAAVVPTPVNY